MTKKQAYFKGKKDPSHPLKQLIYSKIYAI